MTDLPVDWTTEGTARRRDSYYAATQTKFVPFKDPIVFRKGQMQYLWDAEGNKYTDLLGMNVCISVGHSHPKVVAAAQAQAADLGLELDRAPEPLDEPRVADESALDGRRDEATLQRLTRQAPSARRIPSPRATTVGITRPA